MIKNLTKVVTLVIVMIGFSLSSNAQETATASNVAANAKIIAPITISAGTTLSFGDVVTGATGGTVVMPTSGTRTKTGDVALSASGPGSVSSFDVTGEAGYTYSITLPSSPVTLTNGTDQTMEVTNFVTDQTSNEGTLTGGLQTFLVGATLNVGALQVSGVYTGSYDVTVTYN